MKKKTVFRVVAFLLVLQAQTVFAADDQNDFRREIRAGNFSKAENILKGNIRRWNATQQEEAWMWTVGYKEITPARALQTAQLLQKYNVRFGNFTTYDAMLYHKSEELIRYLINIGIPFDKFSFYKALGDRYDESFIRFLIDKGVPGVDDGIYYAIYDGYGDNLVQYLLEKGAKIDSATLRLVAEKKRWTLIPIFASRLNEDDMNYRRTRAEYTTWYNSLSEDRKKRADPYDPTTSKTALMFAAESGRLSSVRLLIEKGARVNLRADDGSTAASLAYDAGEIEVYNYLKAHGAIDFEPRQVTQQPAVPAPTAPAQSTTNVYVQPTAPAQSTPAQSAPSQPQRNIGKEIADAFKSPLQSGTYSLVGTQEKISLASIVKSGVITQTYQGRTYQGTYNIDGNRMTVQIRGYTFVFNITSETSFSGHGETWVRTGF
jgi:hypothetical protein